MGVKGGIKGWGTLAQKKAKLAKVKPAQTKMEEDDAVVPDDFFTRDDLPPREELDLSTIDMGGQTQDATVLSMNVAVVWLTFSFNFQIGVALPNVHIWSGKFFPMAFFGRGRGRETEVLSASVGFAVEYSKDMCGCVLGVARTMFIGVSTPIGELSAVAFYTSQVSNHDEKKDTDLKQLLKFDEAPCGGGMELSLGVGLSPVDGGAAIDYVRPMKLFKGSNLERTLHNHVCRNEPEVSFPSSWGEFEEMFPTDGYRGE